MPIYTQRSQIAAARTDNLSDTLIRQMASDYLIGLSCGAYMETAGSDKDFKAPKILEAQIDAVLAEIGTELKVAESEFIGKVVTAIKRIEAGELDGLSADKAVEADDLKKKLFETSTKGVSK